MKLLGKFFGPPNLEKLKKKSDAPGLIKAMTYRDPSVASEALQTLRALVHEKYLGERHAILAVIRDMAAHFTPAQLFETLFPIFDSSDSDKDWELAAAALRSHVEASVRFLDSATSDTRTRFAAIRALGLLRSNDSAVIECLSRVLQDEKNLSEAERKGAIVALIRCGPPRAERTLKPHYEKAGISLGEAVDTLLTLYQDKVGFGKGASAAEPVREVGRKLHELGGFSLMVEVHAVFSRSKPNAARNLEMVWDGVGMWQG